VRPTTGAAGERFLRWGEDVLGRKSPHSSQRRRSRAGVAERLAREHCGIRRLLVVRDENGISDSAEPLQRRLHLPGRVEPDRPWTDLVDDRCDRNTGGAIEEFGVRPEVPGQPDRVSRSDRENLVGCIQAGECRRVAAWGKQVT
jgi:hypothetical protein